jgi:hypothetical protein
MGEAEPEDRAAAVEPHQEEESWWAMGLLASATGLVASILLSLILVIGLMMNFGPLTSLERAGADWGMAYFTNFKPQDEFKHHMVFLDIDLATCRAFKPGAPSTCETQKPVTADMIVQLVTALESSKAAEVVIDVAPFETKADLELLKQKLPCQGETWVIAPVYGRPEANGNGTQLAGDPEMDIAPSRASRCVRLASFLSTSDPTIYDGVERAYPPATSITGLADQPVIPSAALLAATVLDEPRRRAIDCQFYKLACVDAPNLQKVGLDQLAALDHATAPVPIFYSLPSLALPDPDHISDKALKRRLELRRQSLLDIGYERQVSGDYLIAPAAQPGENSPGPQFRADKRFEGAIVFIGSSLASAQDVHQTPMGPMVGSEHLINVSRAFAALDWTRPFSARLDIGVLLELKIAGALVGALCLTPIWLLTFFIAHSVEQRRWFVRVLAGGAITAIFVAGLGLVAFIEVRHLAENLEQSLATGRQVDILTPILALGLEGYLIGAKVVERGIERGILWVIASLKAGALSLWKLARQSPNSEASPVDENIS